MRRYPADSFGRNAGSAADMGLQKIQDGGLQSAEAEIQARYFGFGKSTAQGCRSGISIDQRPARVRKTQQFGRFVKSLPGRIVQRLPDNFQVERRFTKNDLRMPPADSQT